MGFDLNAQRDSDKCTPLHLAIWKNKPEVIKALSEIGVDWTLKNSYGEACDDNRDKHQRLLDKTQLPEHEGLKTRDKTQRAEDEGPQCQSPTVPEFKLNQQSMSGSSQHSDLARVSTHEGGARPSEECKEHRQLCASEEERGGDETRKREERRDEEEAGGGGVGEVPAVGELPAQKINSVTDTSETKQKAAGCRRASAGGDGGVWEISEIRPEISEIRPSSRSAAAAVSELHVGAFSPISPISPYQVGVAGVALLVKKT